MLREEFNSDVSGMTDWFAQGDIVIVDRVYRDAIPLPKNRGLVCRMPSLLLQGQREMSTEEANESRLVTVTLVEGPNGHLSSMLKFSFISCTTVSMTNVVHLGDFCRMAGVIFNKYYPSIRIERNTPEAARRILRKAQETNIVKIRVEAEHLHLRNGRLWVPMNDVLPDFPQLDLDDLVLLTEGTYQINLSPSYIQDKLTRGRR